MPFTFCLHCGKEFFAPHNSFGVCPHCRNREPEGSRWLELNTQNTKPKLSAPSAATFANPSPTTLTVAAITTLFFLVIIWIFVKYFESEDPHQFRETLANWCGGLGLCLTAPVTLILMFKWASPDIKEGSFFDAMGGWAVVASFVGIPLMSFMVFTVLSPPPTQEEIVAASKHKELLKSAEEREKVEWLVRQYQRAMDKGETAKAEDWISRALDAEKARGR